MHPVVWHQGQNMYRTIIGLVRLTQGFFVVPQGVRQVLFTGMTGVAVVVVGALVLISTLFRPVHLMRMAASIQVCVFSLVNSLTWRSRGQAKTSHHSCQLFHNETHADRETDGGSLHMGSFAGLVEDHVSSSEGLFVAAGWRKSEA